MGFLKAGSGSNPVDGSFWLRFPAESLRIVLPSKMEKGGGFPSAGMTPFKTGECLSFPQHPPTRFPNFTATTSGAYWFFEPA
jgi:hypothetical protein